MYVWYSIITSQELSAYANDPSVENQSFVQLSSDGILGRINVSILNGTFYIKEKKNDFTLTSLIDNSVHVHLLLIIKLFYLYCSPLQTIQDYRSTAF